MPTRRTRQGDRRAPQPARTSAWSGPSRWLAVLVIVGAGVFTYANSLTSPFILDDLVTVVDNTHVRHLWPLTDALFSERETPAAGRPLVNLSFALNYAVSGTQVRGYHVVNLTLHLLCGLLLFGVVRHGLLALPIAQWRAPSDATSVALATALLWLLHPLNTETVDYITQRTELMMAVCYLLAFYAMLRADEAVHPNAWWATAVTASAMGLACKEPMVTAPVLIWLYDWRCRGESIGETWRKRKGVYVALVATWLVLVPLLWSGPRSLSAGFSLGISVWTNLLNQAVMITQYLKLSVWPTALVLGYGYPRSLTLLDVWPSGLLVVTLLGATIVALGIAPRLGFLGAWVFITLAPSSSIVPMRTEVGAERRMYLPLMALMLLAVAGLAWMARAIDRQRPVAAASRGRVVAGTIVALLAGWFATETHARNRDYQSPLTMAHTVLTRWPTGFAHLFLATELINAGDHPAAMAELTQAVVDAPRAHYTLGSELMLAGRWDDAFPEFAEFVRVEPQMLEVVNARNSMGRILAQRQQFDAAAEQFRRVLQMDPSFTEAHGHLAGALFAQGQYAAAISEYQQYLAAYPHDVDVLINLGTAWQKTGQSDQAIRAFRAATVADPTNVRALRDLAIACISREDWPSAIAAAQQAVGLAPTDPIAHLLLGVGFASQSKREDAAAEFRRVLQLDPSNTNARRYLAQIQSGWP